MPDLGRWTSNGGDPSLNAIARTDKFLDALAMAQPPYPTDAGEAELANLLAGWRDEARERPATAVVTEQEAVMALRRGSASRPRTRLSMAVVGSVAAAMLCLGGFGSVVYDAGPGDALYGLRTMLFGGSQTTRDDQVVLAAQTQLQQVQQLIEQGQWQAAQDKLQTLTTTVATVNDVEQKQELVEQWQELTVKVETKDANATVPPNELPPTFPDLPAVVLDTTTSTTTPSETTTTSLSPSPTTSPSETTTSPSETTTPSTPLPTPTPSTPLPSPTPSTYSPLPTPTPSTYSPLPTPTPSTYSPLPTPPASTYSPLPTPTTYTALPTPTPLPTPSPTPSAAQQEDEGEPTTEPPILQAPAPQTVITTTTVVVPDEPDKPR